MYLMEFHLSLIEITVGLVSFRNFSVMNSLFQNKNYNQICVFFTFSTLRLKVSKRYDFLTGVLPRRVICVTFSFTKDGFFA